MLRLRISARSFRFIACAVFLTLLFSPAARADEVLPLYEAGAGVGGVQFPHYPGSDKYKLLVLPFPYLIYRGQILKSDREQGTRARILQGVDYEINLNVDGAFPVSSADNDARNGMADLGWVGEIGPRLRAQIFRVESDSLRFEFAVRPTFMTDFKSYDWKGTAFEPSFNYEHDAVLSDLFGRVVDFKASLSALFATEPYASMFYQVQAFDARANRPAYNARGGYIYSSFDMELNYHDKDERNKIVGFIDFDSLDHSVNEASPLVRSKLNTSVGIAYIHVFYKSEKTVTEKIIGDHTNF